MITAQPKPPCYLDMNTFYLQSIKNKKFKFAAIIINCYKPLKLTKLKVYSKLDDNFPLWKEKYGTNVKQWIHACCIATYA